MIIWLLIQYASPSNVSSLAEFINWKALKWASKYYDFQIVIQTKRVHFRIQHKSRQKKILFRKSGLLILIIYFYK